MTIGILGLGLVGAALAERLHEAGVEPLGFDPDPARAGSIGSSAALLAACDTVILTVYDADQIEAVLFQANAPGRPSTFICVTTATPSRITDIARRLAERGQALIEFPLSGTSAQIRRGEALGLVAGDATARAAVGNILAILCPERLELGPAGDAARAKLGINLVLQLNRAALAEGLAFAAALGLDPGAFLGALSRSAARSAVMTGKGPKMVARDYTPESRIAQTLKDADMILDEAAAAGQALPLMTAQRTLLHRAIDLAGEGADSAAVMEAVRPPGPRMINAAIFGLGRWGRSLVQASGGGLRFTRAVEPDTAAAADFAARHGLRLDAEAAATLADPAIQAVVLATPHSQHRAQVEAAAAAGKAVFCEKPLALNVADARAMLAACRRAGVPMAVGHNRRFWPSIQALRGLIAAGSLGQLLHIEAHNSNLNSDAVTGGWRMEPGESPAGGMTGAGLHALDACIGLFGPLRRVTARLLEQPPAPAPRDSLSVLLEFANGTSGTMATVRATPFFWRVHVFGALGSAEVLGEHELVLRRAHGPPDSQRFAPIDSLRAELDAFAAQVESGAPPAIAEESVLATMIGFEAVICSIATGGAVDCDDP